MIREEMDADHEEPLMLRDKLYSADIRLSQRVSNRQVSMSDCVFVRVCVCVCSESSVEDEFQCEEVRLL